MQFLQALPIPSREPVQLEFVPIVAATIPAQLANTLIKQLCTAYPLANLKHLKRVRKPDSSPSLSIILCAGTDLPKQPQTVAAWADCQETQPCPLDCLPDNLAQLVQTHELQPTLVGVPAHAPHTRDQWQAWSQVWPITWKIPDQAVTLPTVSQSDQVYFEQHMAAALRLASEQSCSNAALIVDPTTGSIMAQAVSNPSHPLDHAAMVAIRAAAARDRQLWPKAAVVPTAEKDEVRTDDTGEGATSIASDREATVRGQAEEGGTTGSEAACQPGGAECEGIPGPGGREEDGQASQKRPRLQGSDACASDGGQESSGPQPLQGSVTTAAAGERPYMCTGYDCFLVQEPCIMCAMGLVHSRLQRVVYCRPDPSFGALGGRCRLHAQRSLNHHYTVFHLPLKAEQSQQH